MKYSLSILTNKLSRLLSLVCFSLVFSSSAYAVQCLDIFSQSHRINGPSFNTFSFPNNNSNTDISRGSFSTVNVVAGNYRDIFVRGSSVVTFSTVGGTYNIRDLTVYANSTVRFSPGDYYIDSFHFGFLNRLEVIGNGTVRIFVRNRMRSFQDNEWNVGGSGNLMVYAGNLNLARNNGASFTDNITFNGAIYTDNLTLSNPSATIVKGSGSLASRNNRSISSNQLSYSQSVISNIAFGGLCEFATLQSQWNLDEAAWSGNNSVLDSVGTNHGSPMGGLAPLSVNPVVSGNPGTCNYGRFDGQNDYFVVDNNLGNDFTLMAWIRPTQNFPLGLFPYDGQGLFWSDVGGPASDFLIGGVNQGGQNRISFMVGGTGTDIVLLSGPITLNQWTHVAITRERSSGDMAIFINGVLSNSRASSNTLSLTANPVIAVGGNTLDNRYFNGDIDDVKFYSGVASAQQISQAMGETRNCPTTAPVVEYRFDNFHSSVSNSVLDSSGNNNHGTAFNASTAQGLLCTAADFSATGNANYIVANRDALNGLSDFTAMAWIKTTQTHDSTIFSAASGNSGAATNEAVFFLQNSNQFWPTITASPFNTSTRLSSTDNINDGQWHQVVWTRDASTRESCFFVDGVAQGCVTHPDSDDSNAISVATNGLILGQEQDSLGGNFEINQSFDGLMDEFMVFDYVMPQSAIATINTNIRSSKNWDGTPRGACQTAVPVVDMRFDENSWSGSNSVLDSSGNNYHGTPFGSASPVAGMSCNALDLRQTGTGDYVTLSNQAVNGLQDFSVVFWGQQTATNSMAPISGAGASNNEMLLYFQRNGNSGNIRIRPYLKGDNFLVNTTRDTQWHQFAWTRESATRRSCIYRDGVLLGCDTHNSGNPLVISPGGFIIGQEQDSVGGSFDASQAWNGLIDELLIFPTVLTQAQIQEYRQNIINGNDWKGGPKACNNTVDHYRFEFSPTGLTCRASDITLKACENASCSTLSSQSSSLTLAPTGLWNGADVTGNNVSFTGSTNLQLSQNTLATINLSGSNLNPAPSSSTPIQCFNGSTSITCQVAFKDTGFLFNQIPTQISAKPSDVEFNGKDLTIQAVSKNPITGACENIFPVNTDVDIQLKTNCVSGSCASAFITKEGGGTAEAINGTYSDVTLRFGANSTAKYTYSYFQAGEMSLSARKVVTLPSGAVTTLEESSNQFVIKPFGFRMSFPGLTGDPFSDGNPSGDFSDFTHAGEDFTIAAQPIAWQSGEDTNNDGMIDVTANHNGNPLVSNYNGNAVNIKVRSVTPSSNVQGLLAPATATSNQNAVSNVVTFSNINYSEVGVVHFTVEDDDYRGAGKVIGYLNNVGRFIPHHFSTENSVAGNLRRSNLSAQCQNFTYIGELESQGAGALGALRYDTVNPAITITARNKGGDRTQNYVGNYNRLNASDVVFTSPNTVPDTNNSLPVFGTVVTGNLVADGSIKGQFIYTASSDDRFAYTRVAAAKIAPFSASFSIVAERIRDADTVNVDTLPSLSVASATNHKMHYGRVQLTNTFGNDGEVLGMPMTYQFFNGSDYVTHAANNSCMTYTPNTDILLTQAASDSLSQVKITQMANLLSNSAQNVLNGTSILLLPASNEPGSVDVEFVVPPWLRFDWDNNGASADTNPKATAVFGRYRGNDRIINWRERR